MPSSFLHPQLDISKIHNAQNQDLHKSLAMPSVTIEPTNNASAQRMSGSSSSGLEIRRTPENIDNSPSHMNINNNNSSNNNKNNFNNYAKEESSADERQDMSDDESIAVN